MIRIIDDVVGNVLAIEAVGKVTAKDYSETIVPELDRALAFSQKIRLLYVLGEQFEGFEVGALFDDFKTNAGHMPYFERIAVVSDRQWVHNAVKLLTIATPCPLKSFNVADRQKAESWVVK